MYELDPPQTLCKLTIFDSLYKKIELIPYANE
jgi:hypothetical protein